MGQVDLPEVQPMGNKSTEEYVKYLANIVAILKDEIENILGGRLSSNNIREIAGYNVSQTELKHKSGIVGMSGEDPTNPDAVRYWSGDADKENAPYRVYQKGKVFCSDILIQTSEDGNRVEISSLENLFKAINAAGAFVKIVPDFAGAPGFIFDNEGKQGRIFHNGTEFAIMSAFCKMVLAASGGNLELQSASNDIDLQVESGYIYVPSWDKLKNRENTQSMGTVIANILSQIDDLDARVTDLETAP